MLSSGALPLGPVPLGVMVTSASSIPLEGPAILVSPETYMQTTMGKWEPVACNIHRKLHVGNTMHACDKSVHCEDVQASVQRTCIDWDMPKHTLRHSHTLTPHNPFTPHTHNTHCTHSTAHTPLSPTPTPLVLTQHNDHPPHTQQKENTLHTKTQELPQRHHTEDMPGIPLEITRETL